MNYSLFINGLRLRFDMNWIETSYPKWVLQHRWYIIFFSLVFVMPLAASGGRLLNFTTSYRVFFSEDNPQLLAFEALENTYVRNDNVLIVFEPNDGNASLVSEVLEP